MTTNKKRQADGFEVRWDDTGGARLTRNKQTQVWRTPELFHVPPMTEKQTKKQQMDGFETRWLESPAGLEMAAALAEFGYASYDDATDRRLDDRERYESMHMAWTARMATRAGVNACRPGRRQPPLAVPRRNQQAMRERNEK